MITLGARAASIPFRSSFAQASKVRDASESVLVVARRGDVQGIGEGCPRPYQTGETIASVLHDLSAWPRVDIRDLEGLRELSRRVAMGPVAWCAMETALLDLLAREQGLSVERLLDQPEHPRRFHYTTVLGMKVGASLLDLLTPMGIDELKLKVGLDLAADQALLAAIRARRPEARIRLDANNAFGEDEEAARRHLSELSGYWAVEEPLRPGRPAASAAIARALGVPVILDEAVLRPEDVLAHAAHGEPWILNVKVSRAGGVLRALELVKEALGWWEALREHAERLVSRWVDESVAKRCLESLEWILPGLGLEVEPARATAVFQEILGVLLFEVTVGHRQCGNVAPYAQDPRWMPPAVRGRGVADRCGKSNLVHGTVLSFLSSRQRPPRFSDDLAAWLPKGPLREDWQELDRALVAWEKGLGRRNSRRAAPYEELRREQVGTSAAV